MVDPYPQNIVRTDVDWTGDAYEAQMRAYLDTLSKEDREYIEAKGDSPDGPPRNRQERRHGREWEPPEKWRA
jgi:hypothetical protein